MRSTLTDKPELEVESFDGLLATLLRDQQDLTAVERFAEWHDQTRIALDDETTQVPPPIANQYVSLMPATSPSQGQQYAFEVDLDACSGCKACVIACHNLNGLESSETWRKVGLLTSHNSDLPIVQHVTTACHHCVDPGCLSGCPVKAYDKDPLTGIVRHLDDQCFGCKYCTMMCPYEVPQYSVTLGIVRKCDMCSQRLNFGEAPACVQACPNEAIRITLVQSLDLRKGIESATTSLLETAPPSHITVPSTVYVSKRKLSSVDLVSHEAIVDQPHEGHWPLVAMLVLTQASVGMWCTLCLWQLTSNELPNNIAWIATSAAALGIIGVHFALAHLGRPWLAFRAFLGWRTSWLSREAIVFGFYMASGGGAAIAFSARSMTKTSEDSLVEEILVGLSSYDAYLAGSTAFIGLLAVACSGMIYVATHRSLWNWYRTGIEFSATTFGLGLAICYSIGRTPESFWMLPIGVIIAGAGLVAKLHDQWRSHQRGRWSSREWKDFSARSGRLLNSDLFLPWWVACSSWFAALALSSLLCSGLCPSALDIAATWITLTLLAVSQIINRWLYFASIVTYRMPGAST